MFIDKTLPSSYYDRFLVWKKLFMR